MNLIEQAKRKRDEVQRKKDEETAKYNAMCDHYDQLAKVRCDQIIETLKHRALSIVRTHPQTADVHIITGVNSFQLLGVVLCGWEYEEKYDKDGCLQKTGKVESRDYFSVRHEPSKKYNTGLELSFTSGGVGEFLLECIEAFGHQL